VALGAALRLAGLSGPSDAVWLATTLLVLVPMLATVIRDVLHREPGVDVIALLAMVGAVALHEYLAGAVIAVMLSGGQSLETFAEGRAHRELAALLARAPSVVHRYEEGQLTSPVIDDVRPGDLLLVKPGEIVPTDGVVASGRATLDESALTGESRPVERDVGDQVRSGASNAGGGFDLRAVATAGDSTYAGIVRLVREAHENRAPFVRMADRYALIFLPVTLVVAGLAWAVSGDPVRALAVLVVATPCPLILAAPIAMVAGMSRAARRGVIFKGGAALEALGRGRILLFDKTGTLTAGFPRVADVETFGGFTEADVLRLAASLDQVSPHVLAGSIVRAARSRGLTLAFPTEVLEEAGAGIAGEVDGRPVRIGTAGWAARGEPLPARARSVRRRTSLEGASCAFVSVDGRLAGALVLDDPIRPETPRAIRALRRAGIARIVMVTGDHPDVAETVGMAIGVDGILAERTPDEKVEAVTTARGEGVTIMVGDGLNDAPALAAADVGVAMGARGASASSEAADVVVTVDRLDRLAEALLIAKRSRRIAVQSVVAGMAMSAAAMVFAAFGFLRPVAGAILQEAIDVAVILNALRALKGEGPARVVLLADVELGERFRREHVELLPLVDGLRTVADGLDHLEPSAARATLTEVREGLEGRLLAHEREEERALFPAVGRALGGDDPMGAMSRAHMEITHLIRRLGRLVDDLPPSGPDPADLPELRRILYGLHAVLRLHNAQEEEAYLAVLDEGQRVAVAEAS
jgi:heavy metal translocating P-type ATPase